MSQDLSLNLQLLDCLDQLGSQPHGPPILTSQSGITVIHSHAGFLVQLKSSHLCGKYFPSQAKAPTLTSTHLEMSMSWRHKIWLFRLSYKL